MDVNMKNKLIIFDLDGTLVDSLEDIAESANIMLQELGYEPYEVDEYRQFVGDGARELVKNSLPEQLDEEEIDEALKIFKSYYGNKVGSKTKPYDGIYEMLERVSDICDLALLSNKPHKFTLQYMEHFFKEYDFKQIHGQKDEVPRKPDPAGAFNILKDIGQSYQNIFYVGDTATDMKTAVGAKLIPIGILWGYQDEKSLLEHGAKYIANDPKQLSEIVLKN
jgi:phosphoglycolate phosphatase